MIKPQNCGLREAIFSFYMSWRSEPIKINGQSNLNHPDEHEVRIQLYFEPRCLPREPYWDHLRLKGATIPTACRRPENGRHRCRANFLFVLLYPAKVRCNSDPFAFCLHTPYNDTWIYLKTGRKLQWIESYLSFHLWHCANNSVHNYHRGTPIRSLSFPLKFL